MIRPIYCLAPRQQCCHRATRNVTSKYDVIKPPGIPGIPSNQPLTTRDSCFDATEFIYECIKPPENPLKMLPKKKLKTCIVSIEKLKTYNCKVCRKPFLIEQNYKTHLKEVHRMTLKDKPVYTCVICPWTTRNLEALDDHNKSVKHQLNLKKFIIEDNKLSEKLDEENTRKLRKKPTPERTTSASTQTSMSKVSPWYVLPQQERYYAYMEAIDEDQLPAKKPRKKPSNFLRADPAIIPLDPTVPQSDPRVKVKAWDWRINSYPSESKEAEPKAHIEKDTTSTDFNEDELL